MREVYSKQVRKQVRTQGTRVPRVILSVVKESLRRTLVAPSSQASVCDDSLETSKDARHTRPSCHSELVEESLRRTLVALRHNLVALCFRSRLPRASSHSLRMTRIRRSSPSSQTSVCDDSLKTSKDARHTHPPCHSELVEESLRRNPVALRHTLVALCFRSRSPRASSPSLRMTRIRRSSPSSQTSVCDDPERQQSILLVEGCSKEGGLPST